MAKLSKQQIIAQLDIERISYDENMSYAELLALLPKEQPQEPAKPVEASKKLEPVAPEVPLGVSTINDHEKRIWAIEKKLEMR